MRHACCSPGAVPFKDAFDIFSCYGPAGSFRWYANLEKYRPEAKEPAVCAFHVMTRHHVHEVPQKLIPLCHPDHVSAS